MNKALKLEDLKRKAFEDKSLPLRSGAKNLVFGVGNPDAEILFIGEGPGYWEDIKAEPFVGPAGKLLDKLLGLVGIKRGDVFITNVVMHRPPNNRDPLPEEIEAYRPYLDGIIKIISPSVIVTLGRFSMGKFLPNVFISRVHGKSFFVNFEGLDVVVVPMYHPAAALRNGDIMVKIREDFLGLQSILERVRLGSKSQVYLEGDKGALGQEKKQMELF